MPTTLTLENLPDDLYERLKFSAKLHRRSINNEAILCLEMGLMAHRVSPEDRLARARALRASLPAGDFRAEEIDRFKREGRAVALLEDCPADELNGSPWARRAPARPLGG